MLMPNDWQPYSLGGPHPPMPGLAKALRARLARIGDRWRAAVKQAIPAAEPLALDRRCDDLRLLIEYLAWSLESDKPDAAARRELIGSHGKLGFDKDLDLNEFMVGFSLLRGILPAELAGELGRDPSADEMAAVHFGLDDAQQRGVMAFTEQLTAQLRAADELQSGYISCLNHEIRGAMNGVLLMAEVLKREVSRDPRFAGGAGVPA